MNVDYFACCVAPARIIRVIGEATTSLTQGVGHSSGDPQVYRTKVQIEALRAARDPIVQFERTLQVAGLLADRDARLAAIKAEILDAVCFAEASPYPADAALTEDVYA